MTKLSETDLQAIMARCDAAQPGPWKAYLEGRDHESGSHFIMVGEGSTRTSDIELTGATEADYDFIANAKQDIPRLISEIKRLKIIAGEK